MDPAVLDKMETDVKKYDEKIKDIKENYQNTFIRLRTIERSMPPI